MSNGFTEEQLLQRNADLLMQLQECKDEIKDIIFILKDKNYINNRNKIKKRLTDLTKKIEGVNT